MDLIFCTLFDSNYLDKGIVLYNSMRKTMKSFKLYVFAFDDIAYDILLKENYQNMIVVSLNEFETEELKRVKEDRTKAEYCWTCTSWCIKYVLEHFKERICTYIDADMMFWSSPQPIFDEMKRRSASIIITPHRFKTKKETEKARREVGEYCVEFNTFLNDERGLKALNWWANNCLRWCYYAVPGTTKWYGDQKYLNVFPEKFKGVMICEHFGVGLAPWNIDQVRCIVTPKKKHLIQVIKTGQIVPIVIYHYESVSYLTHSIINTPTRRTSKRTHDLIYDPYCDSIVDARKDLFEKYNFRISTKKRIVTNNPLMKIYQKYLLPIRRLTNIRNLYFVKEK